MRKIENHRDENVKHWNTVVYANRLNDFVRHPYFTIGLLLLVCVLLFVPEF